MDRKELEMKLQKLEGFSEPKAVLEQYRTPARIASTLLWKAYMSGEIKGKKVCDLGCGTGTLAIGAKLLGASEVVGVDVDEGAIETARKNAERLDVTVEFEASEIGEFRAEADLVVQNPPFGSQKKGNDRPFIRKSLEIAPTVYSFHMSETEEFVKEYVKDLGGRIAFKERLKFPLSRTMPWHDEDLRTIKVTLYRFERS
ncbi:MAG: METTL5 family protein [Candidatus Aenigmatarchaeota archaeon]